MERIGLTNEEFEGDNTAYLFDGERTTLVDTGVQTRRVREQLEAGLARYGLAPSDLDAVLVTHWHQDHAGLAGTFQRAGDATVWAHPADAVLVAGDPEAASELQTAREERLDDWGMPPEPRSELEAFLSASSEGAGDPADVHPLAHGEAVRAGDETLQVVHTPGHTAGHCCFRREDGSILSGDTLLPEYTPNVGGADPRITDALGEYLDTLDWFANAGLTRAYPGHRDPIENPAERAREILTHHRERTGRVLSSLRRSGPSDAWTVSADLFGSLSGIHILHGPGEASAHLEHLRRHGLVERVEGGYRAVDEEADLDALFP